MNQSLRCLTLSLVGSAMVLVPHSAAAGGAPLVADAYTYSAQPTKNFGVKTSLVVQGPPAKPNVAAAYLQFSLSTLPAGTSGSDVARATLTLGVNKVTVPGAFDVFRVLGGPDAWSESGLTGNAAPPLAGTAEVSGVAVASTDKNDFKTIDITQLVKDWLDDVLPNNGIALVPSATGVAVALDSKESTATSHWAQLDVELGTVPNFSGALSGDVTGTQTATHVTSINGAAVGSLGGATNGQILTFNGANWSPSTVVSSLAASSGVVPVGNGGTGASTAAGARTNLGAAASGANTDIVSLKGASDGSGNTAVGDGALYSNASGFSNTGVGKVALSHNTTGARNTAVGQYALQTSTTGVDNTAVGLSALDASTTGSGNTAVGEAAAQNNTTGNNNTALGQSANQFNTTGNNNTAVGQAALHWGTSGNQNTAVGQNALANNTADASTAVGYSALGANTGGTWNTALGSGALATNTTGPNNVAVGVGALGANNGQDNTAVGTWALSSNTTGWFNTAVGGRALNENTTATENSAVGVNALRYNATGESNTAVGSQALTLNITGYGNTGIGQAALNANTGNRNTALGAGAGSNLTTGENNIDIGNGGVAAESATIRIGDPDIHTATYIAGIDGSTVATGDAVYVGADGKLGTVTSSARFKTDIQDMGDSTSKLMQLRPVRFRYKQDIDPSGLEQYGLVAEEVAKVYPNLVVYDDHGQPQTVRYHFINAMLLNEVQKQQRRLEKLGEENTRLRGANGALQSRIEQLETAVGTIQAAMKGSDAGAVKARRVSFQ